MAKEVELLDVALCEGYTEVPAEWLPAQGKFVAIIFDTLVPGPPQVRSFDSQFEIRSVLAPSPGFNHHILSSGQTALKAYVFNDQGVCVGTYGSL